MCATDKKGPQSQNQQIHGKWCFVRIIVVNLAYNMKPSPSNNLNSEWLGSTVKYPIRSISH